MTTAPDVLYLRGGELYDDTATAWDARNLQPLVEVKPATPLTHRAGCQVAEWPDLAEVCPCTATWRYLRRSAVAL